MIWNVARSQVGSCLIRDRSSSCCDRILQEGLFSDPAYGGNRDKLGWRFLGHPGVWLENSAEENLTPDPVTKGGRIQSLADVATALHQQQGDEPIPGFDPQRGAAPPAERADVVLVGVGGVGGFIAPVLAGAGLKVVGLEAGPYWRLEDFQPDELGATYYCRAEMGAKFKSETPRWRRNESEATQELTFSLGRMMNGVGGSVIHYGGWLRRFPAHNFRLRSHALECWGPAAIPDGSTVVDWPVSYDELRPYFAEVERIVGIGGDEDNVFLPHDAPYPLPPTRPFRMGEMFIAAARSLGLHPHASPVGMTTRPYNGYPEMTYTAWNNGFGSWTGDKWHPGLTSVREALATGNFDLRTHCRVTRVLTDADGRARGVEYVDALGRPQTQLADTVILAAYTFENVRLLFLSGDDRHPDGLGNNDRAAWQALHEQDVPARRRVLPGHGLQPACRPRGAGRCPRRFSRRLVRLRSSRFPRWRDARRGEPVPANPDQPRNPAAGCPAMGEAIQGASARLAALGRRAHAAGGALVREQLSRHRSASSRPQRTRHAGDPSDLRSATE